MDPAEAFLAKYPPEMRALTHQLRALVNGAMPGAKETLYASQNHFGYSLSGKPSEQIVYLVPMQDYVRLGFMWGGYLPDPEKRLVGKGKRMRLVKVRNLQEASAPALKQLVEAAWADARANRMPKKT